MKFVESRLLGVHIDETSREVSLSIIDTTGTKFALELHGVERLLVSEMRQQNIIEDMRHWTRDKADPDLREAAFFLMTGVAENDCEAQLAMIARDVVERVVCGELEMMEVTAIFGAQILASFASMTLRTEG